MRFLPYLICMGIAGTIGNISSAHEHSSAAHLKRRQNEQQRQYALAQKSATVQEEMGTCTLTLELLDADGKRLPGLIRVHGDDDRVALPNLIARPNDWYAMSGLASVNLPRTRLTVEAIHGLHTERTQHVIDLSDKPRESLSLRLRAFYRPMTKHLRSGNTHLHLQRLSRAEADRYLQVVPAADGLDILYVSYLERAVDDLTYITNRYTAVDLEKLSTPDVILRHGEEHRHNFAAYGEGYGHVMFLDITKLVKPVSIGPGITQKGTDGIPLQRGIESARADGATIIWCHNMFGMEDIPNWMAGTLHAQNIFDGGAHGTYEDTFYRYLNIGLKVPFSTGTDWFIYDFSRVYVPITGPLTSDAWRRQLAAGRSFITNGAFLEFTVNGHEPGDTVALTPPGNLRVHGRAVGRSDFKAIEVVHNGKVIHTASSHPVDQHYRAEIDHHLTVREPGWLALRVSLDSGTNEFNEALFAHTSPVYVEMDGETIFQVEEAQRLLSEMQRNLTFVTRRAKFADEQERKAVLEVHRTGISLLQRRMSRRGN